MSLWLVDLKEWLKKYHVMGQSAPTAGTSADISLINFETKYPSTVVWDPVIIIFDFFFFSLKT
jgi:hypothetical protein